MKFQRIKNAQDLLFQSVWTIYKNSFPADEKRILAQQKKLFRKREYFLFAVLEKEQLLGFLSTWNLDSLLFIEHFAVKKELRRRGIGTKTLQDFILQQKTKDRKIILEAERPNTNFAAKKRIVFYERLGFKLCSENYMQPPYFIKKKPVPLFLMQHGKKISSDEFIDIREKLYRIVYGLNRD